jgi:hypothetical protein
MPYTPVTREQFEVKQDCVIHNPTGASFVAYPGIAEPHSVNWGRCGDVLPNGDDYSRREVQEMAVQLMRDRKQD